MWDGLLPCSCTTSASACWGPLGGASRLVSRMRLRLRSVSLHGSGVSCCSPGMLLVTDAGRLWWTIAFPAICQERRCNGVRLLSHEGTYQRAVYHGLRGLCLLVWDRWQQMSRPSRRGPFGDG